ncbi:CHAT domain-containing protein [Promicromonospora soli]
MPPIEDALVASIEHWRSAYPIHPILAVGGWSDAELFLAQVRGSQVPDDVGAAVVKAITELGRPSEGPLTDSERWRLRGQLLRNAKALRLPLEHPGTAGIEATDLDDLAAQFGRQTPRIVNDYVVSLSDYDPAASLAVLEHFSTVFADPAVTGYQDLVSVAANYVQINYKAHVSSEVPIKPDSQTFDEFASAYVNEAKTPFLVATRALRLACLSGDYDAEDSGLSLLALASQEAPLFAARIKPHIKALAVVLHTGEAVNRYSASDVSGAAANYMRAVQYCVSLKQQEILAELLVRLDDVVIESDEKTVIDVAVRLALVAPDVLRMVGPDADAWLAQILGDALGSLVKKESVKLAALWTVLLLRAGLRTSLVLSNATVPQIDRDEECRELLAKLKGVPDQLSDRAKSMRTAVQDRYRALSLEGAIHALPVLSLDQVRRVVDGSTVLLVTATAFSRTEQGRLALLVWDDGATAAWGGWKPIQDEVDLVSPALIYQLQQLMARGKRHLCVFADGGLQTIPWHRLLIDEDMLLGDRWLVTLLPHPSVLMRGRRGGWVPRTPTYPVVAFGVQNAGPDWEPLEDAVDEASAIADFLGGRAVPDADATKAAFRELSEQCRYLHIATHGVFHADHPAFHAVLLSPSDEDDGILHAYEVANLDLSAVELVTLSACETAQLTVSAGDNVDGLPLAFLTAGARAVVGTQIEVETGQSRFFFEALYRELALDPDLRPAFVAARDATRATFPESDAWASFYLLGGWT